MRGVQISQGLHQSDGKHIPRLATRTHGLKKRDWRRSVDFVEPVCKKEPVHRGGKLYDEVRPRCFPFFRFPWDMPLCHTIGTQNGSQFRNSLRPNRKKDTEDLGHQLPRPRLRFSDAAVRHEPQLNPFRALKYAAVSHLQLTNVSAIQYHHRATIAAEVTGG